MTSVASAREDVRRALPRDQAETVVFFETRTKDGLPQLLVLTDRILPPSDQVTRKDVWIRYYARSDEALGFIGRFYRFIGHGLEFAYIDDWNNVHVFVRDEFMARAYGFQHNNVQALRLFLDSEIHIYPASPHYRDQIRRAAINRLLLIRAGVLADDAESIFNAQRGIFDSVDDLGALDLDSEEQAFHESYDFDQRSKSYVIALGSGLVSELTETLRADSEEQWARIVTYAAALMNLKVGVHHLSQGENNGRWARVRLVLPDGATDLNFYEKRSVDRWNKVVVEKSTSAMSRLVTPYFLTSLRLTLTLREASRRYLAIYLE